MARSLPLARFGVVGRSGAVVGRFRNLCTCPDLGTFFRKNAFQHIFLENASQIGFRIPEVTAPRTYQRQRSQNPASGNERPSNPGVQGQSPGPLSPHFSGEMGTPRRAGGATGRCASRWLPRRPPKGYAAPCRPWQVVPLEPPQVRTCGVGSRPVPGGDPGFL